MGQVLALILESLDFDLVRMIDDHQAEAHTRERWLTVYGTGTRVEQDVVNHYGLHFTDGGWRVDSTRVYTDS